MEFPSHVLKVHRTHSTKKSREMNLCQGSSIYKRTCNHQSHEQALKFEVIESLLQIQTTQVTGYGHMDIYPK